jgi:chromosome segregation ATPase
MQDHISEILIGHKNGLNANYVRPSDPEIIEQYKRVAPALTLLNSSSNNEMNKKEISELKQQYEAFEKREEDKDREIERLRQEQAKSNQQIAELTERLREIMGILPKLNPALDTTRTIAENVITPAFYRKKQRQRHQQQRQEEQQQEAHQA